MIWTYQMNYETVKECKAALRKVKGSPIRKQDLFRAVLSTVLTLFFSLFFSVLFRETFRLSFFLLIFILSLPITLLSTRNKPRKLLTSQLPARYTLTIKDGFLREEIILRDGSVSSGEKPLSDVLLVQPFCKGILIRLSGPLFIFLPQAAFRQIHPQEGVVLLQNAIADNAAVTAEPSQSFPREPEGEPKYGTLYFDLPATHIYRMYMKSILHLYRNPFRYLRIAYRNGVISLSILGILFLCCAAISPRILVPGLAVILLLVLFLYALNLLLVIWRYYLLEKKNSLSAHCGPQSISLYEYHLTLCRSSNEYQFFYHSFSNLYETKDACYLLQKNPSALILIPKWAFHSPHEETLFTETLRKNIAASKKH